MTAIPDDLAELDRWACWRSEEGRKVPYRTDGRRASSTSAEDWGTLEQAQKALATRRFTGLGFCFFREDGLVGLDLDDALVGGEPKPIVRPILERFADTYCEISPSGSGLKFWSRGTVPQPTKTMLGEGVGLEVYTAGRYFTFTGERFRDSPLDVTDHTLDFQLFQNSRNGSHNGTGPKSIPDKIGEGGRHTMLVSAAGKLRRAGLDSEEINGALQVMNTRRCEPPRTQDHVRQIAESMMRYTPAEKINAEVADPDGPSPLAEAAYHGPLGEFLRTTEPETEADPAALLLQALCMIGNLIGRGPYFICEDTRHFAIVNVIVVGATSKARKGTSVGRVRALCRLIDPTWDRNCVKQGLSSGEGLIFQVRDASSQGKKTDPGVLDKRLLVIEAELAAMFSAAQRQGNTLSPILRTAFDSPGLLSPMTRNEILKATDPHISMIGHVTLEELKDVMSTVQIANGFANRQLWCWARRSKILPDGGARLDHHSLARKISNHLANLKNRIQVVDFTEEARATWRAGYSKLSEAQPGMLGSVTSRAEALTMRLALIYALIDGATVIEDDHLRAGLAVWDYCQRSAAFIFGDRLGNTVADTILEWLQVEPAGISRWEISNKFGRNVPKERIESALSLLVKYSRAHPEFRPTSGRSIETWVIGA